jgi:hypothetical protein
MATNEPRVTDIFDETFESYTLHTFPIVNGKGYYVEYESRNAQRQPVTHYRIKLIWDNGDTEEVTAESPQELELWTVHLGY